MCDSTSTVHIPSVSVVLPFYNARSTILRTLNSIAGQTAVSSIELIAVDDGSTDGSGDILVRFLSAHPSLKNVTHAVRTQFRRGVAHAMATGIALARGIYVARIDADDYYELSAIETMLNAAKCGASECKADVVCARLIVEGANCRDSRRTFVPSGGNLNNMPIDTEHFSLCNKLISRELLLGYSILPVEGIDCWEDVSVSARAFAVAKRVVEIPDTVYHYTYDASRISLSHSHKDLVLRQRLMCALLLEQWFAARSLADKFAPFLLLAKFHAKIKMLRGDDCDIEKWKCTFPEVNKAIMSLRLLPLHLRIAFRSIAVLPKSIAKVCCGIAERWQNAWL